MKKKKRDRAEKRIGAPDAPACSRKYDLHNCTAGSAQR